MVGFKDSIYTEYYITCEKCGIEKRVNSPMNSKGYVCRFCRIDEKLEKIIELLERAMKGYYVE